MIEDQIVVDILTEKIRRIPEGTGWILDGFPQNYPQAKLLEKALSGYAEAEDLPTIAKIQQKVRRARVHE